MKKLLFLSLISAFAAAAVAQQQSLGDVARANRAKQRPTATTNLSDDNFARSSEPPSGPASKADAAGTDAAKADDKNDGKSGEAKDAKKDAAADDQKKNDRLKGQVEAQKKEIATLQRELDIAEREAKLRSAAYYADAGVMLRDQAKFAEDSRKAQAEIDGKKQALSAAQEKLADLQEQARKAGLPSSD